MRMAMAMLTTSVMMFGAAALSEAGSSGSEESRALSARPEPFDPPLTLNVSKGEAFVQDLLVEGRAVALVLRQAQHERTYFANRDATLAARGEGPAAFVRPFEPRRPGALPALYVTLGVLQGLDVYTTTANLKAGAQELNPAMQPVAGNLMALSAVKAATTATSILLAEKLWRRHKTAAIVSMVASNVILTTVVAHNFRHRPR